MDNYTFGRRIKKIQWRANLPIILTVVCVIGIIYGIVSLVVSQLKPAAEPISTITITKNTPSASELNLSAPLVDYNPNKDECQEEKLDGEETDEQRDKRLAECKEKKEKEEEEKKKKEEEEKKDQEEEHHDETTEVLGEQESAPSMMEVLAKMIGASAAQSNENARNTTDKKEDQKAADKTSAASSADSSKDEVHDSVGEDADN